MSDELRMDLTVYVGQLKSAVEVIKSKEVQNSATMSDVERDTEIRTIETIIADLEDTLDGHKEWRM